MHEKTVSIPNGVEPSPEDLAAEYLSRKSAGEPVDVDALLARLKDEAARKEFETLIAGAGCAERGLPRAMTGGTLLAGRYRIREPIGQGGMGRVFSAVDERLGCTIAVKLLDPLEQGNRERVALFEKESKVLAELKHPGIVAVHDAGRDGAYTYIVMDLVIGTSLADVLDKARSQLVLGAKGNRLPARDGSLLTRAIGRPVQDGRGDLIEQRDWYRSCGRILLEITRTLEAAHGKKVVHRDLKPQNVMLQGGGSPVILDFGLAGSPELSTGMVTENLYGSVCYLAPEQARSQKIGMDPRTDVYQLGLILYEMLTLRRAFPGNAIGEVLQRIESGFYEMPRKVDPRVPRDLEAICTMALEVSPERRYSGAREMREDLERWLEGRSPVASRSAPWRTFARTTRYTARRHPVMSAAAAVVLSLGVGALAWGGGKEPVPWLQPASFDLETKTTTLLPAQGGKVHPDQYLGVKVSSTEDVYLYAFSRYGKPGEELRLSPWRATVPEDLGRFERLTDPFVLKIPAEEAKQGRNVLCTEVIAGTEPESIEGLLVFASTAERPQLEDWMTTIAETGEGVPYEQGLKMLRNQLETRYRGVSPRDSKTSKTFTDEETRAINEAFGLSKSPSGLPDLELPGIGWCSVECRVAPK